MSLLTVTLGRVHTLPGVILCSYRSSEQSYHHSFSSLGHLLFQFLSQRGAVMTHWGRRDLTQPSTGVSNNRLFQSFCVVCQRKDLHLGGSGVKDGDRITQVILYKYCKLILRSKISISGSWAEPARLLQKAFVNMRPPVWRFT